MDRKTLVMPLNAGLIDDVPEEICEGARAAVGLFSEQLGFLDADLEKRQLSAGTLVPSPPTSALRTGRNTLLLRTYPFEHTRATEGLGESPFRRRQAGMWE